MHCRFDETTAHLECTFQELVDMTCCGWAIYATPTPQGLANQAYIASRPQYRDDFLLASVEDFDDTVGYDITGGWEEMTQAGLDAHADETFTCVVPRTQ